MHLSWKNLLLITVGMILMALGSLGLGCEGDQTQEPIDSASSDVLIEADPTLVVTASGPVRGVVDGESRRFSGIPYAAPPVGENRFAPPQIVEPWTEERDATELGPVCPQADMLSGGFVGEEDCLTLNIWTPSAPAVEPRPVMVFLHGGVFVQGAGSDPMYDAKHLASAGEVVVVTINYRLGALGFLAHRALAGDPNHPASGNYGVMDQQQALRWVRDNIAPFGGDPDNVTLFGESVGAVSVGLHLVAPGSAGLFRRIIAQSGSLFVFQPRSQEAAFARGQALAEVLGCADGTETATCLRTVSPERFVQTYEETTEGPGGIFLQPDSTDKTWAPTLDGVVFTEDPLEALKTGDVPDVEVIIGTNKDEGTIFLSGLMDAVEVPDASSYSAQLRARFGNAAADIEARYPLSDFESPNAAVAEISGDAFFHCPARRMARLLSQAGIATYLYSFERAADPQTLPSLGVCHASEIMFIFGQDGSLGAIGEQGQELSAAMASYWTNFARTGDPNSDSAFAWPRYNEADDELLTLDLPLRTATGYKQDVCDFWDGV